MSLRALLAIFCGLFFSAAVHANAQTISCYSNNGRRTVCEANIRRGVRLVRQQSRAACIQGQSWGFDRRGIWVDRGCGGDFALVGVVNRPPGRPVAQVITCSSGGRRTYCRADVSRGIRLIRQRSGRPCEQGRSWGFDQRGIWVDRGCSADFAVGR